MIWTMAEPFHSCNLLPLETLMMKKQHRPLPQSQLVQGTWHWWQQRQQQQSLARQTFCLHFKTMRPRLQVPPSSHSTHSTHLSTKQQQQQLDLQEGSATVTPP
jgi:hypothetical protein